ncbi:MAG: serine/threonine-protein kinase [Acidobacteriota bacterium]
MESKTWTAVSDLFLSLLEVPEQDRHARLAAAPGPLRAEVLSLLAAHAGAGRFIEPAPQQVSPLDTGARLGPYRLIEKIGEGGMGAVYRAERDDGEFRRMVAVKVPAGRLFGPEAERRFLYERQILARLDHPNVVRLLDGGIQDGRRYLVMEFVAGQAITHYCDGRPLVERLRLFQRVCEGLQFAHRNLVIHRDVKPSNILVTEAGEVKILDFGIAQMIAAGGENSTASVTALHPMTLEYASPEQVRGQPLTIAADIYSLGVLLYEILAGRNPQAAPGQSIQEAVRRITVASPTPPGLASDLDAITLKCLAKEPEARYSSVEELRIDVERFLGGLPVLAHPPSAFYLARKFIRRNRALSLISTALMISLVAGAAAFAWQARISERRFADARRLIRTVIFDIQPRLESIPATLPLRKTLIDSTSQYLEALSRDAGGDAGLLAELAGAYRELARLQGDGSVSNMGSVTSAATSAKRAERFIEAALKLEPANPAILAEAGRVFSQMCMMALQKMDLDKARAYSQRQSHWTGEWLRLEPSSIPARKARGGALFYGALIAKEAGSDSTVALFDAAAQVYRELARREPQNREHLRAIALTGKYSSDFLRSKLRFQEAKPYILEAVAIDEATLAAKPSDRLAQMDLSMSLKNASGVFSSLGQPGAALGYERRALAIREQLLAADPGNLFQRERMASASASTAEVEWLSGHRLAALAHAEKAASIYESMRAHGQLLQSHHLVAGYSLIVLATIERGMGREASGCRHLQSARPIFAELQRMSPLTGGALTNYQRLQDGLTTCPKLRP